MARELAAVYSQVFGLALESSLLTFSDPDAIDSGALERNRVRLRALAEELLPLLREQNATHTSGLSLELEHLVSNARGALERASAALLQYRRAGPRAEGRREAFFDNLHMLGGECARHVRTQVIFFGGHAVDISLGLINDAQIFMERLSSVFYCISAQAALACLGETVRFIGQLRGTSPIPDPDTYVSSLPCARCLSELAMLPNQGESPQAMRAGTDCPHVCRPVKAEPVRGLFENELVQLLGIDAATWGDGGDGTGAEAGADRERDQNESEYESLRNESLVRLGKHHIFERASAAVLELSNLIYWNSGTRGRGGPAHGISGCSQMGALMRHEATMHARRAELTALATIAGPGGRPRHFFDTLRPEPLEALFCGGVFCSTDDTIDALRKDCSTTFLRRANYQSVIRRQNELYVRLSNILRDERAEEDAGAEGSWARGGSRRSAGARAGGGSAHGAAQRAESRRALAAATASEDQVRADARARRDAYVQKITRDGLRRLHDCLEKQGDVLRNALTLRVWGSATYEAASRLLNHYLAQAQFLSRGWEDRRGSDESADEAARLFEDSKYVRNSLHTQALSREHVDALTLKFYELVTGPLSRDWAREGFFPVPENVALAHCLDAAGVMPHHMMLITEMIWPTIESKDWVDPRFNRFYCVGGSDLTATQREAWTYVRELVLSVALYNRIWEKDVTIFSTLDLAPTCPGAERCPAPGVYLTYEPEAPLVLIHGGRGWVFKDLYALLYHHLQLSGARNERSPASGAAQTAPASATVH
ncbi:processing and transport protein [Eptesicus fuscus gammaherpesvirus]|uniref:Processing and transport protein n=2 Tax=Gammaherpesvirinae TaxID=10374 RepID=A0A2D1A3E5_9GAMA|nr:processing and transport protein [Eptesicus fuscus gammaherpesvirus]ATA58240.1 processing and transport protein [Eptesicus fuscus gammaherpesvirus]